MTHDVDDGSGARPERVPPRIYAHRGSMQLAPENTQLAFDVALGYGADVLELDVRLTRDKRVIVFHDESLDRTTNGRGRVRDTLLSELGALNAGHGFVDISGRDWSAAGAVVDTLDDVLERYPDVAVNVDIKDRSREAAVAVARCITDAEATERVVVGSFHAETLAQFRQLAPEVHTAASVMEVAYLYFGNWLNPLASLRTASPLPYEYLQIPRRWRGLPLTARGFIDTAHRCQVQAIYWTVNEPQTMMALWRAGADGIVTDRPDLASAALRTS